MTKRKKEIDTTSVRHTGKIAKGTLPESALLSEPALAKEWLKPEEERTWEYL